MSFEPIAITGQGCVLPSALNPAELWKLVVERRSVLGKVPEGRWRVPGRLMLRAPTEALGDGTISDWGGYVTGFEQVFDPTGFVLPSEELQSLDPLFQWLLHVGRTALESARYGGERSRAGVVVGNLSYPCASLARFAERVWLGARAEHVLGSGRVDPRNRFMSGLPAHLLARALALGGPAFALDAACASSLYAIKFACDALHDGRADLMLAGAVSCADDLFIHAGFSALGALSPTGQSRPFAADADGLVPAEGAVLVALRRLSDARRDGDPILGVIRGVGLSNDGRGRGLLVPSRAGQVRALRSAYQSAGLEPTDVSLLECHATGTLVGDAVELETLTEVFGARSTPLALGSLKANLGHLITAAGGAGLLKVLAGFEAGVYPPAPLVATPRRELLAAPLRLVGSAEPWRAEGPRRAGINAFGFGGNNAHLIVEEPPAVGLSRPIPARPLAASRAVAAAPPGVRIAVVALGARVGSGTSTADFARALFAERREAWPRVRAAEVGLPRSGLRFPPKDLQQTLPQQLLLLAAALEAVQGVSLPNARTGTYVGMQCDAEIARHGARWRVAGWAEALGAPAGWAAQARDGLVPLLGAAGVIGAMPNIVANRASQQLDLGGPSLTISAEELSGLRALELARRALESGELDAALVGAVDLCVEPVHEAALAALGHRSGSSAGDAAVVLVLKREQDAERAGDPILAVFRDAPAETADAVFDQLLRLGDGPSDASLARFGYAHAAWGLLHVAAAVLYCARRSSPNEGAAGPRTARVTISALGGQTGESWLEERALAAPLAGVDRAPAATLDASLRFAAHWPEPVLPALSLRLPRGTDTPSFPVLQRMEPPPLAAPSDARERAPSAPVAIAVRPGDQRSSLLLEHARLCSEVARVHREYLESQAALQQSVSRLRELALQSLVSARAFGELRRPEPIPVWAPAEPVARAAPTLTFSRAQLLVHASGRISQLFGERFAAQDEYALQVRMPEPPLLLADRVVALRAEPLSMGLGSVTTETDVSPDSWYLHAGRMPAGLLIEAGQADLLLISYLGIDLHNQGRRVYRLLGCELIYHGALPEAGDTLRYDIHIDGHAEQEGIRLFFFHYECTSAGRPVLSVQRGQAGFFSSAELASSAGVLWSPEQQEPAPGVRVDAPRVQPAKSFSAQQVRAFSQGDLFACFGAGYELGQTHVRTPRIQPGQLLLLERIEALEPQGGPWGRGYLKASTRLHPEDWFFRGHFKNDPCMPGTLMFEGCLQAMAFYLAALGYTLNKDGWRFAPVPEERLVLQCRGQVLPSSRELVCELFVEEVHSGPTPKLYADLLGTVDGLKAFHARRVGLELVPDWPLSSAEFRAAAGTLGAEPGAIRVDGFTFDPASLLACAWGKPSSAFGPMYRVFDGPRKVARLPGPPYHFMSRVAHIAGPLGVCEAGASLVIEYSPPPDAWYFTQNGYPALPFAVLLEVALQPCGWLASYVGSALTSPEDLAFRNLDGTGTVYAEVLPGQGPLRTRAILKSVAHSAGMILESFQVECSVGDLLVARLETRFGFFPEAALEQQVGLGASPDAQRLFDAPSNLEVDLTARPARYFAGSARLATGLLSLLDRVTACDPQGGAAGLGSLRAEKDVRPEEWFFKAHFFQDPVQPGSLGLEAMLQLLQFYLLHQGLGSELVRPRFQPLAFGRPMTWKYRGQVTPRNRRITITLELTELGRDASGPFSVADASLWVDGKRIYQAQGFGMRLIEGVQSVLDAFPSGAAQQPPAAWLPAVVDYWGHEFGISAPAVQQLYFALLQRFVRYIQIEDVDALRRACQRPVLFLANHQVAVESTLFAIVASSFVGVPILALAKIENREHWLELLMEHGFAYPGHSNPRITRHFDRSAPDTLPAILEELGREMARDGRSLLVHVEGSRALSCRPRVQKMSGTLIELALRVGCAIVPVRFTGGLPVAPLEERAEFPLHMARQDIHFGRPIAPDELEGLNYRERIERVLDGINRLGPSNELEQPLPPDPAFEDRVRGWMDQTGSSLGPATLYRLIEQLADPCPELAALVHGARDGQLELPRTATGRWLGELAQRLYGPRGPKLRQTEH